MDELGKMLVSPVFWVGTFVVGILINFLSQFLYPRLGALPGRIGRWRRARSAKREAEFSMRVYLLRQHRDFVPLFVGREGRARGETAEFLAVAVLCYVLMFGLFANRHTSVILVSLLGSCGLLMLLLAKLSSSAATALQEVLDAVWTEDIDAVKAAARTSPPIAPR